MEFSDLKIQYFLTTGKTIPNEPSRHQVGQFRRFLDYAIKPTFGHKDIQIVCSDCGKPFKWKVSEQLYFESKGYQVTPHHCGKCKPAIKQGNHGR